MAYTNFDGKVIGEAWGVFNLTLTGTVKKGDLCTLSGIQADADTSPAECVALQDGVSGDVIRAALAASIRKTETIATGGGVTAGTHGGVAGTILYLSGTAGAASEAAGLIAQNVGWCIDTEKAMLMPMGTLRGWNPKYTSTLQVTGATTFCRTMTCSSKATITKLLTCSSKATFGQAVTCSSALTATKTLTASSNTTFTKAVTCSSALTVTKTLTASSAATLTKAVTCSSKASVTKSLKCSSLMYYRKAVKAISSDITLTSTQSGYVFTQDTAGKTFTLPATAAGVEYTFVYIGASTTGPMIVHPNASDKILLQAGAGSTYADHISVSLTATTANKGESITVVGDPSGDGWLVTNITGTWAAAT